MNRPTEQRNECRYRTVRPGKGSPRWLKVRRLMVLVAVVLVAGCSPQAQSPSVLAETPKTRLAPPVPVVVDGPVPALPEFPAPRIPIPGPPYDRSEPHPLPMESVDLIKIASAVEEAAQGWGVPGTFHVNSLWQITSGLQVAAGFYDGVLTAGVVTLPSEGRPRFYPLPKVGGGGPATIIGMKDHWVLIRTGLSYVVFDHRTNESHRSDEYGNPGGRTVLWWPKITAEEALKIATRVHRPNETLWVRFDRSFLYDYQGESRVRPSWIVQTLSPFAHVRVYVDAETGEHFRILESEAPSPDPADLGFISRELAIRYGQQGVSAPIIKADLLESVPIPDPPYGTLELPVWRIELASEDGGRPRIVLIDARSGKLITPGMANAK